MDNRLFVGNLPFSVNEEKLFEYFSGAGSVESAKIILDRSTGRSRGFGFVEMGNDDEATKAIEEFDGKEFQGRNLTVNKAKPREDRGGRSDS